MVALFISECMPGYVGLNCKTKCLYPTYGDRCQENCDCNKDMCDVSTGCKNLITGIFIYIRMRNINKVYQRLTDELIWFCFVLEQYNTSEEIDVPMIANTTVFAKTVSKTDQLLLLSIKMVGGVDIVLLAAYVVICIYDRPGRKKNNRFAFAREQYDV